MAPTPDENTTTTADAAADKDKADAKNEQFTGAGSTSGPAPDDQPKPDETAAAFGGPGGGNIDPGKLAADTAGVDTAMAGSGSSLAAAAAGTPEVPPPNRVNPAPAHPARAAAPTGGPAAGPAPAQRRREDGFWRGRPVTVVREAREGDTGYVQGKRQVMVQDGTGTRHVIEESEITDHNGTSAPRASR